MKRTTSRHAVVGAFASPRPTTGSYDDG
eukprot:COSAG01_NODE_25098_length_755_cov_60.472561_1_plen_27_part_01